MENKYWNDRILMVSFWGLNGGLFLMFITGLLPIGLMQVWYSYDQGFWFARSADFYEMEWVQTLGNVRIVPDTIIIVLGAFPLLYFLLAPSRGSARWARAVLQRVRQTVDPRLKSSTVVPMHRPFAFMCSLVG